MERVSVARPVTGGLTMTAVENSPLQYFSMVATPL
jgi:hypothetical protein